jgi:lysozyme
LTHNLIVDVSAHQAGISWQALRAAGVRGAFLKATEGVGFEDAAFAGHADAARAVGIPTGAYHFARPDTVTSHHDAEAEADWFLHVSRPTTGDLLPALDFETPGLPPAELVEWALSWLRRVGAAIGERPLFYTYPSFCTERLGAHAARLDERALLWLAAWGPNDGRPHAVQPIGSWRRIALHQYTSRGSLPGVASPLDLSRLGPGVSLKALRVGRIAERRAAYAAPWSAFAGGRLVAKATRSWLAPGFQRSTRAAARAHPFVVVRGTRRR